MSKLSEIEPKKLEQIYDLVKAAGVDVRAWGENLKKGPKYAHTNQKYLYEWAFVQPKKVVVIGYWHAEIRQRRGDIIIQVNLIKSVPDKRYQRKRLKFQEAIKQAIKEKLPIRIIVLKGKSPGVYENVTKRGLDPAIWHVTAYNQKTGDCTLTRGAEIENAIDDLSAPPDGNQFPDRASVVVQVIKRDNRVRAHAIKRAKGKCEYCNVQGFPTTNGRFYVEAHHIIALCDSGRDTVDNVVALCPQHHRQAHYGKDAESLESKFIKILKKLNNEK